MVLTYFEKFEMVFRLLGLTSFKPYIRPSRIKYLEKINLHVNVDNILIHIKNQIHFIVK